MTAPTSSDTGGGLCIRDGEHDWSPAWKAADTGHDGTEERAVCLRCRLRRARIHCAGGEGQADGTYYLSGADKWPDEPPNLEGWQPTTVTWCTRCRRSGRRRDGEQLDEQCRYCGGDVRRRRLASRGAAQREVGRLQRGRTKARAKTAEAS